MTALLVSHNGARWLPTVLAGVAASTHRPEALLAVDTGSLDHSLDLLHQAGGWKISVMLPSTAYAAAVRSRLDEITTEWVWLLHDDSVPEPDTLERLLQAAADNPSASILGPKLREWPSLRRLLELGVTISGTGRRETGLERGEYDQGQHDDQRTVLAVNSAGMLVRREVLSTYGFDPALPLFGNDIDFGWRVARAGHRSVIVPEAVMFHAEAAHRGLREGPLAEHRHRREREAAIYTLLVNGSGRGLPWRMIRLFFGSLIRALGFLLVRAPREALGEVGAAFSTLGRPWRILAGRRARRGEDHGVRGSQPQVVRALLAPAWLPYRHGLDSIGDFLSALIGVGRDSAARASAPALDLGDEESFEDPPGLLSYVLKHPLFWLTVGAFVLAGVAARGHFGGPLWGGALPAAPDSIGWWWRTYLEGNHTLGTGTSAPAPAYLVPLIAAGALLFDNPQWVISGLFLLSVPLTMLSALRFLRRLVESRAAAIWGAAAYGLLPVASGAVFEGRLGTVAGALVLPWVATSAVHLMGNDPDRRWRAGWRTGLGGAVLVAFVPVVLPIAVLLIVGLLAGAAADKTSVLRRRERWGPLLAALISVPLLLLPWVLGVGTRWSAWLVEAGRADAASAATTLWEALTGHASGGVGAPAWLLAGLAVAAISALVRGDRQRGVKGAWLLAAVAALAALVVSLIPLDLAGMPEARRAYVGFLLLLTYAAMVVAATLSADGVLVWARAADRSWRQPVAALGVAAGLVSVLGLATWWVVVGLPGPVQHQRVGGVPAYMSELAYARDDSAVLVLDGDAKNGVRYRVLRHGPLRVGDDAITMLSAPPKPVTEMVASLFSSDQLAASSQLADYGIAYVYVPAPARGVITGALDASTSLSRASAARAKDAAWRVQTKPTMAAIDRSEQPVRPLLLGLQFFAVLAGIVLAAPTRRRDS